MLGKYVNWRYWLMRFLKKKDPCRNLEQIVSGPFLILSNPDLENTERHLQYLPRKCTEDFLQLKKILNLWHLFVNLLNIRHLIRVATHVGVVEEANSVCIRRSKCRHQNQMLRSVVLQQNYLQKVYFQRRIIVVSAFRWEFNIVYCLIEKALCFLMSALVFVTIF